MSAAGIFLTHQRSPRIERHFERLVAETGDLVTWHFVYSHDTGPRPHAPFPSGDPAALLASRYRAMEKNGGVQGGFLDTLVLPLLRALPADHLWVMEYDVDYAGRWDELFGRFADNDADLLTSTIRYRHELPEWWWWRSARAPDWVSDDQWVRSFNPLMRLSRRLVSTYCLALADPRWRGHYEFTLPTVALAGGARIEDLGDDGSFTPAARRGEVYLGRPRTDDPADVTFGFRPVREAFFHEAPERFERADMLYHPVKPDVPAWTRATKNVRPVSSDGG